jgi:hypothetical protein
MDAATEPKNLNFLFTMHAVRLLNAQIGELKKMIRINCFVTSQEGSKKQKEKKSSVIST